MVLLLSTVVFSVEENRSLLVRVSSSDDDVFAGKTAEDNDGISCSSGMKTEIPNGDICRLKKERNTAEMMKKDGGN